MNTKVKCFKIRSKVHEVVKVLQNCTHNAFPIVDTDCKMNITDGTINTYGRMRGLMKRHDIGKKYALNKQDQLVHAKYSISRKKW